LWPACQSAATSKGAAEPRRSPNGLQASSGRHFTSKTVSPGKSRGAAVANRVVETSRPDTHRQKNTADGGKVTITVKQIMTGLQTADTKNDRLSL